MASFPIYKLKNQTRENKKPLDKRLIAAIAGLVLVIVALCFFLFFLQEPATISDGDTPRVGYAVEAKVMLDQDSLQAAMDEAMKKAQDGNAALLYKNNAYSTIGAIAMAGALALSLTAPAFASDNTTTTIKGAYADIGIAVVVPETGTAQINPYGLPDDLTKSDTSTVTISNQQIVTQPLTLRNQGSVAMDVNAKLTVAPKGGLAIVTTAPDSTTTA